MNRTLAIVAAALLGFIGLGLILYRRNEEGEATTSPAELGCVKVDPAKFPRWKDSDVPAGTINDIATWYLPSLDPANRGGVVAGFFKGIDTFPSEAAAQYYSKQMKSWAHSKGEPYWQVIRGELLCAL